MYIMDVLWDIRETILFYKINISNILTNHIYYIVRVSRIIYTILYGTL